MVTDENTLLGLPLDTAIHDLLDVAGPLYQEVSLRVESSPFRNTGLSSAEEMFGHHRCMILLVLGVPGSALYSEVLAFDLQVALKCSISSTSPPGQQFCCQQWPSFLLLG